MGQCPVEILVFWCERVREFVENSVGDQCLVAIVIIQFVFNRVLDTVNDCLVDRLCGRLSGKRTDKCCLRIDIILVRRSRVGLFFRRVTVFWHSNR